MKKAVSVIKKPLIFVLVFYCLPALAQVPSISSFTPTSGTIGTAVTITGTNFNSTLVNNRIYFGAVKAIPTAGSTTSLTVTVPVGATSVTPLIVQDMTTGRQGSSITSITPQFTVTISPPGLPAYSPSTTGSLGVAPISLATGDFNNDGKVDIAVVNNSSNNVGIRIGNGLGGFTGSTTVAVGTDPRLVTTGDFNGDGNVDLAVACNTLVSILLGNGLGGFPGSSSVPLFNGTRAVSIGDFNGDGIADFAAAHSIGGAVSIKLGDGLGGFSGSTLVASGSGTYSISVGDFNGDSKADLAIANNSSNDVVIRLGDGTGGFPGSTSVPVGTNPRSIVIGDFNKDGKMDFATANQTSNNVSVRLGDGLGGFSGSTAIAVGTNPLTIAIGDLDGDSNADLITANQGSNGVSLLLGDGLGGFSVSTIAIGSGPFSVATADFNGDNKADLSIANNGSNNVSILLEPLATPTITSFTPTSATTGTTVTITGTNFTGATAVTFGGTAATSFTVVSATSITAVVAAGTSGNVSVTTPGGTANLAGFTFVPGPPVITSFTPTSGPIGTTVTVTGSNFSTTPANNVVYFGATKANVTAATSTQLTVTVPVGATYQPISVLVNGLTAYSSSPFVVTFSGGGTIDACSFAPKVDFALTAGAGGHFVAMSDVDGDGKSDLIVTDGVAGSISVLRNTSSTGAITVGSFAAKVDFPLGANPRDIVVSDLDGDGKPDIAAPSLNGNFISVFRNTSTPGSITTGSFAPKVDFGTGANPFGLAIGDIDGDGKPELVVANGLSHTISVFRNTSSPGSISVSSFDAKIDFATGSFPNHVAIRDMDADGKPDVVVANYGSNTVSVFKNTSTSGSITAGSFAARVDLTSGSTPYSIAIGDLDNDGKPDIVSGNQSANSISVFRNIGTAGTITSGSFAASVQFATGLWVEVVSIGDLDGDAKLDLVVSNNNDNTISVFKNTSSVGSIAAGSFSRIDFGAGTNPYGSTIGDLDGDGRPELAVMHSGSNTVSVYWNSIGSVSFPSITSFTPSSGPIGTSVIITGTNFSTTPANNIVLFNGVNATVTASTATSITVNVPPGSTTGKINVTVGCNTATSAGDFTVTPHVTLGNVIEMNGTTDYVEVADNTAIRPLSLTLEAWVNFSSIPSFSPIINKVLGTGVNDTYQLYLQGGVLRAAVENLSGSTTFAQTPWVPTLGQWYHIAFTYDDATKGEKLYIDGTVVATNVAGLSPQYDNSPLYIGGDRDNGTTYYGFPGKIDEARIWNVARTSTEILSTINTSLSGNEAGLAAYYKMDETGQGAGIIVQNSATATGAVINGTTYGTACTPIFTLTPPPTITSFSPSSGPIGTSVIITGTNFSSVPANNIVMFNGVAATVTASTATSITAIVPAGTTTGTISVTVCNTATSGSNFVVNQIPTSTNASVTTNEDVNFTFGAVDFPFTDDGTFAGVEITSLETAGDLEYNGIDVALNQVCPDVTLLVFKPATDANGSPYAVFDFKVIDNLGASSIAAYSMTVNVTPVNDAPVITAQVPISTPEETALTILVSNVTVVDPDGGAPTLTVQNGINYSRIGNTITPDLNFNGTLTVPVTVSDGIATSVVFNISVIVTSVNDPPLITAQIPLNTPEETPLTILAGNLTVVDPDGAAPTLTVQTGANYTLAGNTITPDLDFNGTLTVPVTVDDGIASSPVFNLSVTVSAVNDAPVITAQVPLTTPEETSLTILVANLTITDVDNAAFTLSVQNGANYTWTGNTITPILDFNGVLTVPITVSDGTTSSLIFNLSVTVTPVNDTPVITSQVPISTPEKTPLTIMVSNLTIIDPDNTVFVLSAQDGINYTRAGNTITPIVGFIGNLTVPVTVNDGTISSAVFNLSVSVTPCVPPGTPTITSSITPSAGIVSLCSGNSVTLSAPGGFTSYLWSNTAATQSINISSAGSYSVVVTNSSGCASLPSNILTVTILPGPCGNLPPVIATTQLIIPIEGKVSLPMAPLISDPDGNLDIVSLKVKVQLTGTTASIGANSTLIADYAGKSFAGTDRLTLEVCDLLGACTQKELTIDVIGDIVIFGGISPNNDGKNDTWIIQYIESIDQTKENKVSLFNRWGDVVFEVENYDNANKVFRGISKNGEDLPTGTYFYKIEYLSGRTTQTGFISLKR